jgi:hypothetical protein
MSKELKLKVVLAFGQLRFYPDCEVSKGLAELADRTSLTRKQVELLKRLGYSLSIQNEFNDLIDTLRSETERK